MANSETIKATIDANINTNGVQAITGKVLNAVLKEMVDSANAEITDLEETTDAKLAKLSEETEEKFNNVDSEIENLKRGEAYVMGESLVFRNYADATIIGNTLTL